jgi:GDPmannose 4,6-dehydratase
MSRALIIGHRGQDGRILWDQLATRGFALVGVARCGVQAQGFEWNAPVDIEDPATIFNLVEAFAPTQVYYLAAHHHSSQDKAIRDTDVWGRSWAVHVIGFGHLLEAVTAASPDTRVFYASSSRVFGAAETSPQDESTPRHPDDSYGVTKAAGMLLADRYRRTQGAFVSCGILYNHESPLRASQFVSQRVVHGLVAIRRGEAKRLELGSLDAEVDWGYAPDYVRAMQAILEVSAPDDFVIATGESHRVRDLVEVAAAHLGMEWRDVVVETGGILQRGTQGLRGDATRLRMATGWQPQVDFCGMVRILVDAALAHEELRHE